MLRADRKLTGAATIVPAVVASRAIKIVTIKALITSFNAWLGISLPTGTAVIAWRWLGLPLLVAVIGLTSTWAEKSPLASVCASTENKLFPLGKSHCSLTLLLGA